MGWTTYNRPKGETDRQHFQAMLSGEILECATVNSVFYAAVRGGCGNDPHQVWGYVALLHRAPNSYYNFGYKDMDENMGPGACEAPAKVLNRLTATDSEWAQEWRRACWATIDRKAKAKAVTPGTTIEVSHPLSFGNGREASRFIRQSATTWYAEPAEGFPFLCRLGANWATRYAWEVV